MGSIVYPVSAYLLQGWAQDKIVKHLANIQTASEVNAEGGIPKNSFPYPLAFLINFDQGLINQAD